MGVQIYEIKRLYSGLMALGLACTLIFQTPVLAAEETAETQTSSISTNSISGWPQGGYNLHSCNDHGRQYTDYRLCQKHGPGSLPRCYSKSYDHASDSGKCTAERSGYYDRDRCFASRTAVQVFPLSWMKSLL